MTPRYHSNVKPGRARAQARRRAPAGDALVTAAASAGVPLAVVDVTADEIGDAWDAVPLVRVRPDQHVAWRSPTDPSPAEATDVVATVTGHRYTPSEPSSTTVATPQPITGGQD